jgi:hypothetical protein
MERVDWTDNETVRCDGDGDAIDQDIFDSLGLSNEELLLPFTDEEVQFCHRQSDNAADEGLDLLLLATNLRDACKIERVLSTLHDELETDRHNTQSNVPSDEELDLVGLMERCEDDVELAIAVLSAFCSQGAERCSELQKMLEEGRHDQMHLQAVCKSDPVLPSPIFQAFYHVIKFDAGLCRESD